MFRILIVAVISVLLISTPVFSQDANRGELGGRILGFVYVPLGTEFEGGKGFSFQPYFVFGDDFNLYGANLVFSGAGSGFYFPAAIVDFDGGDTGVLFGAGYNKFFDSPLESGRWLGDIRYTYVTEADTGSITGAYTHVWYTGKAITYLGAAANVAHGDAEGFGVGGHGGVKFSISDNFVLELQGAYHNFESHGDFLLGISLGLSF